MGAIITEFGRELRKIRIDAGEVLKDMAEKLGYTSSYLSAIEVGKRAVPEKFLCKLQECYGLPDSIMETLKNAVDNDVPKVEINLKGTKTAHRRAAMAFARTFKSLDEEMMENILKLLNNKEENDRNDI
ncbi:MAG: helix-turn-helix domain-containing protein [Lentisphaeria bacterium]|nr:helix-turn-helix domain-containing protein [Lentisphaeria bacterium]